MKEKKTKTKRKLKFLNFLVFCLILVFLSGIFYYFYQMPIKNIIITGTTYLSDYDVIEAADIKNYPPLWKVSKRKMSQKISELDFVKDVAIHKNLFGRLTISITEEIPLFYSRNLEKLVFASGKEIVSQELQGLPILINYVPDEIYARLIKEMQNTNQDVLRLISEIEYQPWKSDDVVIDDTRFYLRMNDGNVVYVNLINFQKLNNYMTIYSTIGESKGVFQLDSSLGNGITFAPFSD